MFEEALGKYLSTWERSDRTNRMGILIYGVLYLLRNRWRHTLRYKTIDELTERLSKDKNHKIK